MANEDSYAPKSPDLSFFEAGPVPGPTPPPQIQQHHLKLQTSGPAYEYSAASSYPYNTAPPHPSSASVHFKQEPHNYPLTAVKPEYPPYGYSPHDAPQYFPDQHIQHHLPAQAPPQQVAYGLQAPNFLQHMPQGQPYIDQQPQYAIKPEFFQQYIPSPQQPQQPQQQQYQSHIPASVTMPPRKATQAPPPPTIEPSPVRTKFPTARIKRIMQADEEVGKVAQQTPIAVGKALEMFMIALVTKSAEVAKEKNSKRVSAQMLKQAIEADGQYDFLQDIAAKVGDEEKRGAGRSSAKAESESDEEMVEPKKKAKGGRKKKGAA